MHTIGQPHVINSIPPTPTFMQITAPRSTKSAMFTSTPIYNAPCLSNPFCQPKMTGRVPRPVFLLAASDSPSASNISQQQQQASQNLLNVIQNKDSTPTEAQLQAAVDTLLSTENGISNPGPVTLTSGSGNWNVVHAPHINRMSSILNTKFNISYTLAPNATSPVSASSTAETTPQFWSTVKYESPLFGSGWLSASGRLLSAGNDSLELRFDTFWVDEGSEKSKLRPFLTQETMNSGDKIITAIGKLTFFEGLARFPVLYLDTDAGVSVFRFPPLKSNITVVRQ